jgi:hypothetical protein
MTDTVAGKLRELAAEIEELARGSRVAGIAREQVSALADYLCLRARLIEIEGRSSPGASTEPQDGRRASTLVSAGLS